MADQTLIHDDIKLYTTAEKFYFKPTINPTEILVIDRISAEACVKGINEVKIPIPANAYKPVCGFLGSIKLISGHYLVVAKYRIVVGKINGHDIYKLAGTDIIPYARSTTHLTNKQIDDNNAYERLLRAALDMPGMYFSYGYDLTHTMQRLHSVAPDCRNKQCDNIGSPADLDPGVATLPWRGRREVIVRADAGLDPAVLEPVPGPQVQAAHVAGARRPH
ncbi:unnamed protein product [Leptidea sinapis]|uniref:Phosphatidylinositol-3-phosphatase SAC1 n=1 Tax=Leptidea sinapis TaxID=189913 RepID=A0A5E4Q274_9NEOP|nr:unnamed protein product [Leptidea sinapis]